MKILIALLFATSLAWGQSVSPATTNNVQMAEHPQHATQHSLGTEQSLLPSNSVTSATGVLPLSDFPATPQPYVSLGQIAKEYREGHAVQRPLIRVIP